jgi:hypothetical protein
MQSEKKIAQPQVVGDIRFVPYAQSDRYPTRCWAERLEYFDCYQRPFWRALRIYESEAKARAALSKTGG